ncbi:MAG: phenylacetate--CoA ligase family protein, partial [Verrucomicrobiota bacterium]|nr:phenylacetate--CoA ligase family protein [Verrucomicrobiota bacterium]
TQNSKLKTICRCGSSEMALAGGILGRVDDMIIIRGVNIYPGAVEKILRSFSEISQFQIQVAQGQSLAELKVKIETKKKSAAAIALVRRVEKSFRLAFNLRIPVVPVLPGTLPCFEMKAQHWARK